MDHVLKNKRNNLFIILSAIFLTNAILAELIGVKVFSLEQSFGYEPATISLMGFELGFNLSAGVIIWPVVFVTTDIINEYFGKQGVRRITFITVGLIFYAFLVIWIVTRLAPADFWMNVNSADDQGRPFDVDFAFNKIYLQGAGIIVGSMVAFLIGQFLDVFIFHRLRKITGSKNIWLRATGSTLVSQLIDSFVVLFIAFHLLASPDSRWPLAQVVSVATINYTYKFIVAIALTPVLYLAHYLIDNYLGKKQAEYLMEEAAETSEGLF